MSQKEQEYVLGTNDDELIRLGYQHRVWGRYAYNIWEEAGFAPGQTILDVGCGPGFCTTDLAGIVGPRGRVIGVDASARFLNYFQSQIAARGLTNIETRLGDVEKLDLPAASIDGAYARWVLCFLRDPAAVVSAVAKALKPGAAFAVQDYFNYEAITLAPRSEVFTNIIRAVVRSWRDHGGDPDFIARLPEMMQRCDLEVRTVRPILRAARPGTMLWDWPGSFFRNFVPALVQQGYLTADEQRTFEREWAARSADPATFLTTPPVFDVIGIKRA